MTRALGGRHRFRIPIGALAHRLAADLHRNDPSAFHPAERTLAIQNFSKYEVE